MATPLLIAIDGPAASGKSTLAALLAKHLGAALVETGHLYRGIGHALVAAQWDGTNSDALGQVLETLEWVALEAIPPAELENDDVTRLGSAAAADGRTRQLVTRHVQERVARLLMSDVPTIVVGRDIGTVVCPQAHLKFFVEAPTELRADRRAAQRGLSVASPARPSLSYLDCYGQTGPVCMTAGPDVLEVDRPHPR